MTRQCDSAGCCALVVGLMLLGTGISNDSLGYYAAAACWMFVSVMAFFGYATARSR